MPALKLLIVKTSSMGDVVHALPAVTDLRRAYPDCAVDWLVEAPFAAIPALHPGVRRVIPLAWRKWRKALGQGATWQAIGAMRRALQAERYDAVLDLQGLLKSVLWGLQARGPLLGYGFGSIREPAAALFYRRRATVAREQQAVVRNRALAAAHLGYPLPTSTPDFGLRAPASAWLPPGRYAVLIPCASRPEKLWPGADWAALGRHCAQLGWQPVLLWGSPAEQALAAGIAAECDGLVPPFLSVGDCAAVLAGAEQIVGLDTGFTHLGAAFGRPTVGIYCDHEPGLAGVTGSGPVTSLGGVGQRPSLEAVRQAFDVQRLRAGGASQ